MKRIQGVLRRFEEVISEDSRELQRDITGFQINSRSGGDVSEGLRDVSGAFHGVSKRFIAFS